MAEIRPFCGIRYNPEKIPNLSEVATPPYDVISNKEQLAYYDRHPNNAIRLDKNLATEQDTEYDNPYSRAAGFFREWLETGILVRDREPAFYATAIEFPLEGQPATRFGLIAKVRLEPFSAKIILPHEQTFSKVKSERLQLMKACHANFSHIFTIYSDPEDSLALVRSALAERAPDNRFTDNFGHHQTLWRITDPAVQEKIQDAFSDRRLYIADGHHRYETALNYREWVRENDPAFNDDHPANFIMMYLCAIEDPGLIILPAHRLLPAVPDAIRNDLPERAAAFFDIITIPVERDNPDTARRELAGIMKKHRNDNIIGLIMRDRRVYYALILKKRIMKSLFEGRIPEPLMDLDVTILTHLVLGKLVGFGPEALDDESKIVYNSRDAEAIDSVENGDHDLAFILNPPTNDQVRRIAEGGFTMPRKTTFYYPKVITGQVMNKLG